MTPWELGQALESWQRNMKVRRDELSIVTAWLINGISDKVTKQEDAIRPDQIFPDPKKTSAASTRKLSAAQRAHHDQERKELLDILKKTGKL